MVETISRYAIERVPDGRRAEELRAKLDLFDSHVNILSDTGRRFHVQWLSTDGSIQIAPPMRYQKLIVQLRDPEDPQVKISYVSIPTDMRMNVCGQDYHLFFQA